MAEPDARQITAILHRIRDDREGGFHDLLPLVLDELRALAGSYLQRERPDHTLQPTALVHEVYLKLVDQTQADYVDRRHFLAVASRAMRQILVDHARRHRTAKRGGDHIRVTLNDALLRDRACDVDLVSLDDALADLEKLDQRRSRVVELRFFGGMTNQEAAEVLGVSPKTTEADWYVARAWLRRALSEEASE